MYTLKLKQNLFQGMSTILENLSPSKVQTLKQMKLASKAADKFTGASRPFADAQKEILDKVAELNKLPKETPEEKAVMEERAKTEAQPLVEKRDEIGEGIAEVELSDEEADFLRVNFKDVLANNFKTIKFALEVADALGVEMEEEKK